MQDYQASLQRMQAFNAARGPDSADEIWLLQHPPVFTLGLNGKREHVLDAGDIPLVQTDRGGQVTYHGPGQLIAYVLLDVRWRASRSVPMPEKRRPGFMWVRPRLPPSACGSRAAAPTMASA